MINARTAYLLQIEAIKAMLALQKVGVPSSWPGFDEWAGYIVSGLATVKDAQIAHTRYCFRSFFAAIAQIGMLKN